MVLYMAFKKSKEEISLNFFLRLMALSEVKLRTHTDTDT